MQRSAIQQPPFIHFFFVFGAVFSLVIAIVCIGSFPGALASLVALGVAPIAIMVGSISLFRRRCDSRFHSMAFFSGLGYFAFITIAVILMLSFS